MQELWRALEQWSALLSDRDSRRRALELLKFLLVAIGDAVRHKRYGTLRIELDFEAGQLVRWVDVRQESHK